MMEEELLSCVTDVVGRVEVRQKSSRYMLKQEAELSERDHEKGLST